ncbi:MAG TPA: AbrB/MazE/SpoVT family DNA-binding domain-containing protein [Mesotoga infera]|jgi:AbrB family looped-hinge helix DNA binding protein|nr:AbrB/MazE/SpoVT family DNA-binding domain-containing protein [Mesotoga infera]
MNTSLSSKGQVTLPVSVRRQLGLQKGTNLIVEIQNGTIVLIPQRGFENLRGLLSGRRVL